MLRLCIEAIVPRLKFGNLRIERSPSGEMWADQEVLEYHSGSERGFTTCSEAETSDSRSDRGPVTFVRVKLA